MSQGKERPVERSSTIAAKLRNAARTLEGKRLGGNYPVSPKLSDDYRMSVYRNTIQAQEQSGHADAKNGRAALTKYTVVVHRLVS